MTLTEASPSDSVTSTLEGLMSRWTMPLVWACWIARQVCTKRSSRSSGESWRSSQNCVIGTPLTSSIAK